MIRRLPSYTDDIPGTNRAGYFNQCDQDKRSITLNLKQPDALPVARDLVAASDIVTNNFAAGVMERMGLGYETPRQLQPAIIMIGYSGYPGQGPSEVGLSYGDPNAGLRAAVAVLAALWHRRRTGEGQYIDMSQWEAAIGLTAEGANTATSCSSACSRRARWSRRSSTGAA